MTQKQPPATPKSKRKGHPHPHHNLGKKMAPYTPDCPSLRAGQHVTLDPDKLTEHTDFVGVVNGQLRRASGLHAITGEAVTLYESTVMKVLRARARPRFDKIYGCMSLVQFATGEQVYIKRRLLKVVPKALMPTKRRKRRQVSTTPAPLALPLTTPSKAATGDSGVPQTGPVLTDDLKGLANPERLDGWAHVVGRAAFPAEAPRPVIAKDPEEAEVFTVAEVIDIAGEVYDMARRRGFDAARFRRVLAAMAEVIVG